MEDEEIEEEDIEYRIQCLVNSVKGEPIEKSDEFVNLSTMEILSRLIYQEQGAIYNHEQDAVLFSIVNRLFSETNFITWTNTNNIYSVIMGVNQYESIKRNDGKYPNAFHPPVMDNEMEKASWENAKRLAAILCIVIEECGESNENIGEKERAENVVLKGDKETYQEVVDFLEQQKDTLGKTLINEIGTRDSFHGGGKTESEKGNEDRYDVGGNVFFHY